MWNKIENDQFAVQVNDKGAELSSIRRKADGLEYMWQGDPAIWSGRAPILFPIVGRLMEDTYTYQGRQYTLPKHGFAKKKTFTLLQADATSLLYALCSDDDTMKMYPFPFELRVEYRLTGNTLAVNQQVINQGKGEMYFSLGAHPAFACDMGDTIVLNQRETLSTGRIDEQAILSDSTAVPLLDNEDTLTITEDLFAQDALVLTGLRSTAATLHSARPSRTVTVSFGHVPVLGIWAKPGAPYVCIEPWYGVNDYYEQYGDITKKREIVRLDAGETFAFPYTITCE